MTQLITVTLTWLSAVVLAALVVLPGGDSATLVPPPEAVGEAFVAELVAGHAQQAMRYVAPGSVSFATLRQAAEAMRVRSGFAAPNDVKGDSSVIAGKRATAAVHVEGRRGRFDVSVTLTRGGDGIWRASAWD